MKHAELVKAAERWLRHPKHGQCRIVLVDVRCNVVGEQPDAIGWTTWGETKLVECKASRSDFARDAKKYQRRRPEDGMGLQRYYCAPAGMLKAEELPESWGLIEVAANGRASVALRANGIPAHGTAFPARDQRSETALLVRALRSAIEGWGRRMFGEDAPPLVDGDPHPTATKIIRELREENRTLRQRLLAYEALP